MKKIVWRLLLKFHEKYVNTKINISSAIYRNNLGEIKEGSYIFFKDSFFDAPQNIFIGKNSVINQRIKMFTKTGKVFIGNNVTLNNGVILYTKNANIYIGDNSLINHDTEIVANNRDVIIKNDTLIGMNVLMVTSNYGFQERDIAVKKQEETFNPITIEKNTWIGAKSVILSGVTIGEGAIVGAGSVVTKSVEKFTVVGGAPAKKIKDR